VPASTSRAVRRKIVHLQDGYQWHQIVFEKLEIDLLNPWLPLEAEERVKEKMHLSIKESG
jgi:hypothetical protein